jgi:hypothetical protein
MRSTATTLKATLSGSGDLTVSGGDAVSSSYVVSGSGTVFSRLFLQQHSHSHLSGSGSVYATVDDQLEAVISGSGNIYLLR